MGNCFAKEDGAVKDKAEESLVTTNNKQQKSSTAAAPKSEEPAKSDLAAVSITLVDAAMTKENETTPAKEEAATKKPLLGVGGGGQQSQASVEHFAAKEAAPVAGGLVCSMCSKTLPKTSFSATQKKKGTDASCKSCVDKKQVTSTAAPGTTATESAVPNGRSCASCKKMLPPTAFSAAQKKKKDQARCKECVK